MTDILKHTLKGALAALLSLPVLASCVKEDRLACPAPFTSALSADGLPDGSHLLVLSVEGGDEGYPVTAAIRKGKAEAVLEVTVE